MRFKTVYIPLALALVFLVGIYGSTALGVWSAEETKEPIKIASGEFEGMPDPEDIRGSYTFGDIGDAFDMDPSIIAEAFGIETDEPEKVKAKDLELFYPDLGEEVEIGTGAIKTFVSLYTGIPYVGEDGIPLQAVTILKDEGKWNDELEVLYQGLIVELPKAQQDVTIEEKETIEESAVEEHEEVVVGEVKGKTTVADLIDWGLTMEQVEEVLGMEVGNINMVIRDICNDNGLSFGEVKTELAALVP